MKLNENMFSLSKQYFTKGKNGFTSATITGERRVGKTMYSMQVVYQICRYRGMTKEIAWATALNSIVFTMDDLVNIIKKHNYDNRRDFLIWDDSGVYGSGLLYRYNADNAMVLKALMDTIGTRVRLLMLTCPDIEGLMKFLRRYQDFLVHVVEHHHTYGYNGRLATVLKPYRAKNLSRRWKRAYNDEFNVKIPDNIYKVYVKKRDSYADTIIEELLRRGGDDGREIIRENFGEEQLVGQNRLLDHLVPADNEGSTLPSRE